MTQKPEGIKSDEFLSTVELFAATVIAFGAGLGTFLALPLSTPFALAIAVAVVALTWAAGSYWGLRWGLISGCLFFAAAVAWLIFTRPFYGDTLFYDDLWMAPGHSSAASATTTDYWKGRELYTETWEQPVRILITDEGVCLDAKGVQWDGTPVTIYSSANGAVEIANTCRYSVAGDVEIRDARTK